MFGTQLRHGTDPKYAPWKVFIKRRLLALLLLAMTGVCVVVWTQSDSSFSTCFSAFTFLFTSEPFRIQQYQVTRDGSNETARLLQLRKRLSPYASITQRLEFVDPPLSRSEKDHIFRIGAGLENVTVNGVVTWREFGVTYIPSSFGWFPKSKLAEVFNSDYEPYLAYDHDVFFEGRQHEKVPRYKRKIILARLAGMDPVDTLVPLKACPDFPCVHTTNKRQFYNSASAITFNGWDMRDNPVAPNRRPDQMFIFYNYEPITTHGILSKPQAGWKNAFNWTMSYNVDSDIVMPYGLVRRRPTELFKDYNDILSKKSKFIAAIISHCPTSGLREKYIQELQSHVAVDVFGRCGPHKCKREEDFDCTTSMSREYKFFLSFENSICQDYITEKFFKFLKTDTILIVRGGSAYHKHAPEGIYINTQDFETPRDLAQHLKYLDRHEERYLDILRAKDQYFSAHGHYSHLVGETVWVKYNWENVPLCEVCQRLWNIDLYASVYPDIARWETDRACRNATDV